jgi:phenylacetate-CoA oxygenase PaaJ subunit
MPIAAARVGRRGGRGRSGIPVLTIADLGVLRDVAVNDGRVEVAITPTYSGCPAMNMITLEIELALEREGFRNSKVRTVLSPAWTTDWMSEDGRRKLRRNTASRRRKPASSRRALFGVEQVACPQCGSNDTEVLPNSVRPPARRCGAARAAASRSTISSVIEPDVFDWIAAFPMTVSGWP